VIVNIDLSRVRSAYDHLFVPQQPGFYPKLLSLCAEVLTQWTVAGRTSDYMELMAVQALCNYHMAPFGTTDDAMAGLLQLVRTAKDKSYLGYIIAWLLKLTIEYNETVDRTIHLQDLRRELPALATELRTPDAHVQLAELMLDKAAESPFFRLAQQQPLAP
jgi:hypothetical protein